jgi:hypothetical protein
LKVSIQSGRIVLHLDNITHQNAQPVGLLILCNLFFNKLTTYHNLSLNLIKSPINPAFQKAFMHLTSLIAFAVFTIVAILPSS